MVKTDGLPEGSPYKILSYMVMDNETNFIPFGRYFGIDMSKILNITENTMAKIGESTGIPYNFVAPSRNRGGIDRELFKPRRPIDPDTAVDCGFGVLELENGERFMFDETFVPSWFEDDKDYRKFYESDLHLRLGMYLIVMYLIVTDPKFYSESLEELFNLDLVRFRLLINTEDVVLMKKTEMAFDKRRNGTRVIKYR